MTNSKALKALELLEQPPPEKPPKDTFSMSIRLPGETAERVFGIQDLGLPWEPPDLSKPRKTHISRNSLVVALIEAGLEAVEAAAKNKPKGKK